MDRLGYTPFDDDFNSGSELNRLFERLQDPEESEQAAHDLRRYVYSRKLANHIKQILQRLSPRLDWSDVVQSVMKSIHRVADRYQDRTADEIRLVLDKIIHNKAIDCISENHASKRDIRKERELNDRCDSIELKKPTAVSRLRDRNKEQNDEPKKPAPMVDEFAMMTKSQVVEVIRNDLTTEQRERLDDLANSLPERFRLVFWLTIAGTNRQECGSLVASLTGQTCTINKIGRHLSIIEKTFRKRFGSYFKCE